MTRLVILLLGTMLTTGCLIFWPCTLLAQKYEELFGPIPAERYLTGRFSPKQSPKFVRLADFHIPTGGRRQYLRRETTQALVKMLAAFHQDHPGIKVWVASAQRGFSRQRTIWEAKWRKNIRHEVGRLNRRQPDPVARIRKILQYTAIPGASRHHWGTDVDFNLLENSYYTKGPGLIFYRWLQSNAGRFGFCQPYTAGRKEGHREEKWHWSYRPLASRFQRHWLRLFANNTGYFLAQAPFLGNRTAASLATIYQSDINPSCVDNN